MTPWPSRSGPPATSSPGSFERVGSHARVNAVVDGGFNLFDHDIGRHTANVRVADLEQDLIVN